jgi:carbon storage regulator
LDVRPDHDVRRPGSFAMAVLSDPDRPHRRRLPALEVLTIATAILHDQHTRREPPSRLNFLGSVSAREGMRVWAKIPKRTVDWHGGCLPHEAKDGLERAPRHPNSYSEGHSREGAMLVLSRRAGQSVRLGNGVRITLVKIDGQSVRIGIEAPEDVGIRRAEIAFEVPESFAPSKDAADA